MSGVEVMCKDAEFLGRATPHSEKPSSGTLRAKKEKIVDEEVCT